MTRVETTTWAGLAASIMLGATLGFGGYTFVYARGASYLTNDPAACANCHIMRDHYDAWLKSPHRHVAVCNDCHTPHAFAGKYATKAANGFAHSFAFTSGDFPEPLRIKDHSRAVVEAACRSCHEEIVNAIDAGRERRMRLDCVRCHAEAGHAR